MIRAAVAMAGVAGALAGSLAGSAAGSAAAAPGAAGSKPPGPGHHTPAGLALAQSALLRRADLGRGWSEQSPPPAKPPNLTCPAFNPRVPGAVETGVAASPTFRASAQGPFVSETAHAYATATQERAVWRHIARPHLLRCAAESLRRGGGSRVRFTVTAKRLLTLPPLPAPARGYRVSGTASTAYQTIDVFLDLFVVGRGQTIAAIVLSSFEQPPRRGLELRLLRTVARRMSPS